MSDWLAVLDAVLVGALILGVVSWLRRTRATMVLLVLAATAASYLLARQLDLPLVSWLLQGVFAISIVAMIVILQPDLRRAFSRLSALFRRGRPGATSDSTERVLLEAVAKLAKDRTGALLVFPGKEALDPHLSGGVSCDADPSVPLLLSLFDPHSPGHDGAVVVSGGRITLFSAHLPLSDDHDALGPGGTRHAAALGLAERVDALSVVVSEERGTISVARDGKLRTLDAPEELQDELRDFAEGATRDRRPLGRRLLGLAIDVAIATVLTVALWLFLAPGSADMQAQRRVDVGVENVPEGHQVDAIEPSMVELTLEGPRSELLLDDPDSVQITLDVAPISLGRRTFRIHPDDVDRPSRVRVVRIEPARVRLRVTRDSR